MTRSTPAGLDAVWAWWPDGHKAKVINVRVQQWKKGDVRLGSGRGDHVGSKFMVVKRKDWQALVSLTH